MLIVAEVARWKKSLVISCKIHSFLVAEIAECKNSRGTRCRIQSLLFTEAARWNKFTRYSLQDSLVIPCEKITRYLLQDLLLARCRGCLLLIAEIQKITFLNSTKSVFFLKENIKTSTKILRVSQWLISLN